MLRNQELELVKKHNPYLHQLSDAAFYELFRNATFKNDSQGKYIDSEMQRCTSLDILIHGTKRIYKIDESGKIFNLFTLSPFQICPLNVMCILTDEPFPAMCQTLSSVRSVSITSDALRHACATRPDTLKVMLQSAYLETTSLIISLSEIVFRGVRDRLSALLRSKASDGIVTGSHQNIAEELGTSREVVSKLLKQMERDGQLSLSRKQIQLFGDKRPEDSDVAV